MLPLRSYASRHMIALSRQAGGHNCALCIISLDSKYFQSSLDLDNKLARSLEISQFGFVQSIFYERNEMKLHIARKSLDSHTSKSLLKTQLILSAALN